MGKKSKSTLWVVQGGTNQGVDPKIGAENISITRLYLIIKLFKVLNKIKSHDLMESKFRKNSFQGVKSKKIDFLKKLKNCCYQITENNILHFL